MATVDGDDPDAETRKIRLTENPDGWWTARDLGVGVSSQGETRTAALENLDEAVALHEGDIGEPVTDDDLREWGIDPEELPDEPADLPEFMR